MLKCNSLENARSDQNSQRSFHIFSVPIQIKMNANTLPFQPHEKAVLFLLFLAIYHIQQLRSPSSSGSGSNGARWKDGKAVGTNIKGVGDLPKPPKGG